jgi:hypothetical protein
MLAQERTEKSRAALPALACVTPGFKDKTRYTLYVK